MRCNKFNLNFRLFSQLYFQFRRLEIYRPYDINLQINKLIESFCNSISEHGGKRSDPIPPPLELILISAKLQENLVQLDESLSSNSSSRTGTLYGSGMKTKSDWC